MRYILLPLCVVILIGCTVNPDTPAQSVYAAEGAYAAALKVELAYSALPRCNKPTSPPLCSDVAIIKKVQKADDLAWGALKEAEKAVRTPGFSDEKITTIVTSATSLTNAFIEVTSTLGIK